MLFLVILVDQLQATIAGCAFLIELEFLGACTRFNRQ